MVAAGLALTAASVVIGLTGVDVAHFWLTLILLGLGWNFGFIGATTMVANAYRPSEKGRAQGFHDFVEFNVEAEGLGYHSTFCVEHHFTGWGQISATLNLLTWLAATA